MPLNIAKLINTLDLYGKQASLYTKSSSKATTCVGFTFTIISFILFSLILYFELYEVFKREHPNVIFYKQNKHSKDSTLSISNNSLNFFITLHKNFEKDNFLSYFHIDSAIQYEGIDSPARIFYENCNDEDKLHFQNFINNFEFPNATNICPRINYNKTENVKNGFNLLFYIFECGTGYRDCIVDADLNRRIRKEEFNIKAELNFFNNQIDMTNYESPYISNIKQVYSYTNFPLETLIELEGTEINSQTFFSFSSPTTLQGRFGIQSSYVYPKGEEFICFIMNFYSNNVFVYKRMYKTFNSAFATSFALFKLFNQIISILLSPIYTYYMNTIIINKNFNYELSTCNKEAPININKPKEISLELYKSRAKKLTTLIVLKNVSLLRCLICRRNRTKVFYDQAIYVIHKHLSVENLFYYLVEYFKCKKLLLSKGSEEFLLDTEGNKLILGNEKKINNENLGLDVLVDNVYLSKTKD
jgi:hypothetical protein